jgi:hypothetical protein
MTRPCPLYPRKRTLDRRCGMSAKGQKRTRQQLDRCDLSGLQSLNALKRDQHVQVACALLTKGDERLILR